MRKLKNEKAITLVALVVTIIVLIILAAVSINLVLGENGIIKKAGNARQNYQRAAEEEGIMLNELYSDIQYPKGPNGKPLVDKETIATTEHEEIVGEDKLGNQVVVPEGFKVASDSGSTVKEGIVIEDGEGNQYVWVPVSNINHDGSNKIKVNSKDEEGVEITLGRYTFDRNTGEPPLTDGTYQYASTYETPVALGKTPTATTKYWQELTTYIESNGLNDTSGTNTTAKDLKGFIESVSENKGYYIARYVASYRENGKAASKISTSSEETLELTTLPETRTEGDLWNFVTQGEAAMACQDLYETVNSDLINSYAYDTVILYIQAMENSNYANAYDGNGTLKNTGTTGDEKCKIFDLSKNVNVWTTEYTSRLDSSWTWPCGNRGGNANTSSDYASNRYSSTAGARNKWVSFRPILYL